MTTTTEKSRQIECIPQAGWPSMVMSASHRGRPWHEIASELIDNALANVKDGESCKVGLAWATVDGEPIFFVIDHGRGSDDIESFVIPGRTGGNHGALGNSIFGTGLFACECMINGTMEIATDCNDGLIRRVERTISKSETCEVTEYESGKSIRRRFLIPEDGGTSIFFTDYKKGSPGSFEKISENIGKRYSEAIRSGDLEVDIIFNSKTHTVKPSDQPMVFNLNKEKVVIDDHAYEVEWGVTKERMTEWGCRLICGGKMFEITSRPCGDYHLGYFYGSIKIPQSKGYAVMDLLKRHTEHEQLEDLYRICFQLFKPELIKSDKYCKDDDDIIINSEIKKLITFDSYEDGQIDLNGSQDVRESNGRDQNGNGSVATGRNSGRSGNRKRIPRIANTENIRFDWCPMGEDAPMVCYESDVNRVIYNSDNHIVTKSKEVKDTTFLASIAASQIAYSIDLLPDSERHFPFVDESYEQIFSRLLRNIR